VTYTYQAHESLLQAFQALFQGTLYRHRDQSLGNWVAAHLFNDLYKIGVSQKFVSRVDAGTRVRHRDTVVTGGIGRRGDGVFGQILPGQIPKPEIGFTVGRGPIAQIEIGAETKVLFKKQIAQIGRVQKDLETQVKEFKLTGGNPICVAFVGVNHASRCTSYEGKKKWPTNGKKHPHPIQEAAKTLLRVAAVSGYDEKLVLPFRATNEPPRDFEWVNFSITRDHYGALLIRVSNAYESRF